MKKLLSFFLTDTGAENETNQTNGLKEKILDILKSPYFYIILGLIALLLIAFFLLKRFIKGKNGFVIVVVRKGKIHKLIGATDSPYYLVPFVDSIGAYVSLGENSLVSENLFINDGPNNLYKIKYRLTYKVNDVNLFFSSRFNAKELIETRINDNLRAFAENGNVSTLILDYRVREEEILSIINESISDLGVVALEYKTSYIEPLGK